MAITAAVQRITWKRPWYALDGVLFSIFRIIAFGLVFNAVQANSITNAMKTAFGFEPMLIGIGIVLLAAFVILVVSVRLHVRQS